MKKVFSVVLILALVLSVCAGFAAQADEKLTKITVSLPLSSEDRPEEGIKNWQAVASRYGLELEWITFTRDVQQEKMNALIASGDIPELFWVNTSYANLYGEDLFVPINTMLDHMPNLAALIEEDYPKMRACSDGNLYFAPKHAMLYSNPEGNMLYRKDILEEMGEDEPTTVEGWYELYKKVHETYPDMIVLMERRAQVEWQMAAVFGMSRMGNNCGIVAQGDQNEIVFLPTTENWKAMVEWYHKLYEEGILYEGYTTVDMSVWWDGGLCTDKVFACNSQNFNRARLATDAARKNGYENVQWWVATMPNNPFTNTNQIYINDTPWRDSGLAISLDCENKETICEFLDWFYGDECMQEQIELMDGQGLELEFFEWPIDMYNAYPVMDNPILKDHFSKNTPLVQYTPVLSATQEGTERILEECEGLEDYVNKMRDEFIMGITSLDEWDAYVEQCEQLGANVAVEVMQSYLDNY